MIDERKEQSSSNYISLYFNKENIYKKFWTLSFPKWPDYLLIKCSRFEFQIH